MAQCTGVGIRTVPPIDPDRDLRRIGVYHDFASGEGGHAPAGDQCRGHAFPRQWQAAAEQPRRWLASPADASLDAWAAMQPRWRAAAPSLDREVTRVGTAAVRGGMEALLNSLHPRISYADGVLTVSFPHDWRVDLGGGGWP